MTERNQQEQETEETTEEEAEEFTPITSQDELDKIIEKRLSRAHQDLTERLNTAEAELAAEVETNQESRQGIIRDAREKAVRREADAQLREAGMSDPKRREKVLGMVEFGDLLDVSEGAEGLELPDPMAVRKPIADLQRTMPEAMGEASVLYGSVDGSQREEVGGTLSREQIQQMSHEEINAAWDQGKIQKSMADEAKPAGWQ